MPVPARPSGPCHDRSVQGNTILGGRAADDSCTRAQKKRSTRSVPSTATLLRGREVPINYLCISGGGSDGAYGAGFLVGWTAKGTRPKFDVVTGISTGSMIAPMAFLGPEIRCRAEGGIHHDHDRGRGHRTGAAGTAWTGRGLCRHRPAEAPDRSLFHASDAGRDRCRVTQRSPPAHRHKQSRGAAPDDMGHRRIAESGHPKSLELVHQIILASASIPGAFPPMNISVTADGKSYNEMHVDGGVTRQVFLYPPSYDPRRSTGRLAGRRSGASTSSATTRFPPNLRWSNPRSGTSRVVDRHAHQVRWHRGPLSHLRNRAARWNWISFYFDTVRLHAREQVGIRQGVYGRAVRCRLQRRPAAANRGGTRRRACRERTEKRLRR